MSTKTCTKCKETKILTDFHKRIDSKDGHAYECKLCTRGRSQRWYKNNSEYAKSKVRAVRLLNPEIDRQRSRTWAENNREAASSRARAWARNNPDRRKLQHHKRRALKRQNGVYDILPKEIRRLKSKECAVCGSEKNLTLDHIIPLNRGGRHSIGNLQSLCATCNSSKQDSLMVEFRARSCA